jgi:hypothetical protein
MPSCPKIIAKIPTSTFLFSPPIPGLPKASFAPWVNSFAVFLYLTTKLP